MIKGMTGFAEREFSGDSMRLKVSIKTLNHRHFDWLCKGTPVGEAEGRLRALCQRRVKRGRVEVTLEMTSFRPESWRFSFNEGLLERILSTVGRVSKRTGRDVGFSLDGLLRIPQLYELRRARLSRAETAFLERCFERTLDDLIRMRRREGAETVKRLQGHVRKIRRAMAGLCVLFEKQPERLRRRYLAKVKESGGKAQDIPRERVAEDVSQLIQKYDISEELTRLRMHLDHLEKIMKSRGGEPSGKKLDFLAQELIREANTINSKTQDIRVVRGCLAVKNEVESVRELVQNIE